MEVEKAYEALCKKETTNASLVVEDQIAKRRKEKEMKHDNSDSPVHFEQMNLFADLA